MKIGILTNQIPFKRGWNDFYPLLKWKNDFLKSNISFSFYNNFILMNKTILYSDIIIIDYRILRESYGVNLWTEETQNEIILKIKSLRRFSIKIILFDTGDSSGSRMFWLTPHVDLHWKKQLLIDTSEYLINKGDESLMCWIGKDYTPSNIPYKALMKEDISKLKVAWNIGMLDYRKFPFSRHYPFGTSWLLNSLYKLPDFKTNFELKNILTVYRGSTSADSRYSMQRKYLIEQLKSISAYNTNVITGSPIPKKDYLKEVNDSKVIISPFGWGEVCYRDFESIIGGSLLLKPSMSHINTYPNVYVNDYSYVEIDWNFSDLEKILSKIDCNFSDYHKIIINGQNILKEAQSNAGSFVQRFKSLVE